jgi:hypothetical protein
MAINMNPYRMPTPGYILSNMQQELRDGIVLKPIPLYSIPRITHTKQLFKLLVESID